jgi:AIR synthase-related protein
MTGAEFEAIVAELKLNRGLAAKADIAAVAARLGLKATNVGDDCAVLPDGDGHLLFAMEGFISGFVAADPWFAGWCGVMVNISDVAAMGGRPLAVCDALWAASEAQAAPLLDGLAAAARTYGVSIVGGHTNLSAATPQLSVAILGRAKSLLTSFDAVPGDALILAADHRGAYREPFDNFQAALGAPPERLQADLALLPEIAERGLARAAKDVSQAGIVGTAAMLAECSRVAIEVDLDAIPVPQGVTLARWLKTFPSYGFLLSVSRANVKAVLASFGARELSAAVIGQVQEGAEIAVASAGRCARVRHFGAEPLMGFRA